MRLGTIIAIFFFSILAIAQEPNRLFLDLFPHTTYLGSESVNPFIINQIQSSLNTRIKPELAISLKSNTGNTLVHKSTLEHKYAGNIEVAFDAVLEKNALQATYPITKKLEGFMEISLNSSSEKGVYNPMRWVVRDNFIEKFHSLMGKGDLYNRKELGYNHYVSKTLNQNGEEENISKNEIYNQQITLGATRYFELKKNLKKRVHINTGMFLKIPFQDIRTRFIESGLTINIVSTKQIGNKTSFTSALHNSMYYHGEASSHNFAVDERKHSYKCSGLLGLNFYKKYSKNKTSVYFTLNKTTSRLKSKYYSSNGNTLNKQALSAVTRGNEYFEIGVNYNYVFNDKGVMVVELAFREDMVLNINNLNSVLDGRNAEDFGVFFGLKLATR